MLAQIPKSHQSKGYLPPPDRLKQELNIQEQVQERLGSWLRKNWHLAENARPGKEKIKSQRGGSVEVFVPHRVNEFVLVYQNKDRVTYNQLPPHPVNGWFLQNHPAGVRYGKQGIYVR